MPKGRDARGRIKAGYRLTRRGLVRASSSSAGGRRRRTSRSRRRRANGPAGFLA